MCIIGEGITAGVRGDVRVHIAMTIFVTDVRLLLPHQPSCMYRLLDYLP